MKVIEQRHGATLSNEQNGKKAHGTNPVGFILPENSYDATRERFTV
jgi:hypothetical protein